MNSPEHVKTKFTGLSDPGSFQQAYSSPDDVLSSFDFATEIYRPLVVTRGKAFPKSFYVFSEGTKEYWTTQNTDWRMYEIIGAVLEQNRGAYVDLGAWIGSTALYGASFGRKTIAVEPNPNAIEHLECNLGFNKSIAPHVTVVEGAVHNSCEEQTLVIPGHPLRSAATLSHYFGRRKEREVDNGQSATTISTRGLVLDDILNLIPNDRIAMLKVDVEGAEVDILKRGQRQLDRVDNVLVELHQKSFQNCYEYLAALEKTLEMFPFASFVNQADGISSISRFDPRGSHQFIWASRCRYPIFAN